MTCDALHGSRRLAVCMELRSWGAPALGALLGLCACGGRSAGEAASLANVGGGASGARGGVSASGAAGFLGTGGTSFGAGGTGAAGDLAGVGGASATQCSSSAPPATPLQRLTPVEIVNTVEALLAAAAPSGDALAREASDYANAQTLPVGLAHVEGYHRFAHDLALDHTRDAASLRRLLDCDPESLGEQVCRSHFLDQVLARWLRRPLTADDVRQFDAVFVSGVERGGSFASGARAVLEVTLQAPEFLYRVEFGEPATESGPLSSWLRPTPYEMAARLSYLLWDSSPDENLLAAAAEGGLRNAQDIELQARRLLADARAGAFVRDEYLGWLGVRRGELGALSGGEDPPLSEELAALMLRETESFIDDVTWNGAGTFEALLTAPTTWLNAPLASFYGLRGVVGNEFRQLDVDAAQRGGLLTQGIFLASMRGPTWRGLQIASRFLCRSVPRPPPNLPQVLTPAQPTITTRQRYEALLSDAVCTGCHQQIEPLGFAFEHYDAAGAWRDAENGLAIDAGGMLDDQGRLVPFDGAVELGRALADSSEAQVCFVANWLTRALARDITQGDACSREQLEGVFARTRGDVPELLVALTQTEAFLHLGEELPR